MRGFYKFYRLTLIIFFVTLPAFAQVAGLPRLKKGEDYKIVRTKMIKAGWKPYHAPGADQCQAGDRRCQGRPEMEVCSGTGVAACRFLWKRRGKTVAIFTVGEDVAGYNGYELVK
jgi:hypothetical protein